MLFFKKKKWERGPHLFHAAYIFTARIYARKKKKTGIPVISGLPDPSVCKKIVTQFSLSDDVEAPSRFELESEAFAELCLTTWPGRRYGAVDEIRTRDIHLGKVALYH